LSGVTLRTSVDAALGHGFAALSSISKSDSLLLAAIDGSLRRRH
jgi:hypothetical protein